MANQIERDIYVKADGVKIPIDYIQGTNAIPLIFHFRDFEIPDGAAAQVFVQKPSGLAVYNGATISGDDVTVDVTTQMFAEVGLNKLQLQIISGEDNLVTFVQPVNVRKNYTDGESEESKNESNLFDELQESAQAANTAAEAANEAAQEIQDKAEAGDFSSTVTIGATTTGEPGTQAQVTNTGTAKDPILEFTIPRGPQGPQGPQGEPGSAGNIDTTPVDFTQASSRVNIETGETVSTLFGKIAKWFADLGTAAFQGVSNVLTQTSAGYVLDARQGKALNDAKVDKTSIVNNLLATEPGFPLDATQGKVLDDKITQANENLQDLSDNKVNGWGDRESVSNPYTPDVDGSIGIYFSPSGNTNATVYATENGNGCFYGSSIGGGNFLQFFPAKAGNTYQGLASQPGTIQLSFTELRRE